MFDLQITQFDLSRKERVLEQIKQGKIAIRLNFVTVQTFVQNNLFEFSRKAYMRPNSTQGSSVNKKLSLFVGFNSFLLGREYPYVKLILTFLLLKINCLQKYLLELSITRICWSTYFYLTKMRWEKVPAMRLIVLGCCLTKKAIMPSALPLLIVFVLDTYELQTHNQKKHGFDSFHQHPDYFTNYFCKVLC